MLGSEFDGAKKKQSKSVLCYRKKNKFPKADQFVSSLKLKVENVTVCPRECNLPIRSGNDIRKKK